MVPPHAVIKRVVQVLNDNKESLGITRAVEISEDPSDKLKPPYAGVFADLIDESDRRSGDGALFDVPVDIIVWIFSGEKKTAADSIQEAWSISGKVLQRARGAYIIPAEECESDPGLLNIVVDLQPKKKPREIMSKTASQSVVAVHFQYLDPSI